MAVLVLLMLMQGSFANGIIEEAWVMLSTDHCYLLSFL